MAGQGLAVPSTIHFVTGNKNKLTEVSMLSTLFVPFFWPVRLHAPWPTDIPHRLHCSSLARLVYLPPGTAVALTRLCAAQLTAILSAGHQLPFEVKSQNLDLPELQVNRNPLHMS